MHRGILYGSSFGFSTPNRSDKSCLNQCQRHFQNIGLLPLYCSSRCQSHFGNAEHKSVLSTLLCYLSILASFRLSIYSSGIYYTTGLKFSVRIKVIIRLIKCLLTGSYIFLELYKFSRASSFLILKIYLCKKYS